MRVGLVTVSAMDVLNGSLDVGAFAMVFLLGNQIANSVQELSFRMLDYFEYNWAH